jgi:hypothetical protein
MNRRGVIGEASEAFMPPEGAVMRQQEHEDFISGSAISAPRTNDYDETAYGADG